ncbi:MAG TPA: branched-chain amino acid ABC transporter permease [Longimicrobium sp.]
MLFLQTIVNGWVTGCVYALLALGFGLIYNTTRVFHIAHGAVYAAAGYFIYTFLVVWKLPLSAASVLTVVAAGALGIGVEKAVHAPLHRRRASPSIHLLSSVGVYIVVVNLIALVYGNQTRVLGAEAQETFRVGELILTEVQVVAVIVFLSVFAALVVALRCSSWGRMLRAMRDDPELVSAAGIDPAHIRAVVFGVGSGVAAIASILLSLDAGLGPHMGLSAVLNAAVAVILGGLGVFESAVLGALALGTLQSLAVWQGGARWQEAVTFVMLLVVLLLRPEGLLGRRRRIEEAAA